MQGSINGDHQRVGLCTDRAVNHKHHETVSRITRGWGSGVVDREAFLADELLQDLHHTAGLGHLGVLHLYDLQEDVAVPTVLQEVVTAEQGVMAALRLAEQSLQVVHVLNDLEGKHKNK